MDSEDSYGSFCPSSGDETYFNVSKNIAPKVEDFVLVKFDAERSVKHYVGKVTKIIDEQDIEIEFLRKSQKTERHFYYPNVTDISVTNISKIDMVLPKPSVQGKTKRQFALITFPADLNNYDIN